MDSTNVSLAWENLQISFPVSTDVVGEVLPEARAAVAAAPADDWRTPYRAATFCIDNGINLDEAGEWIDRSIAAKEGYYNLAAKARLLAKQGHKAEAIAVAKKAVEVGKSSEPMADTAPTEQLIQEWQSGKM